MSAPTPEPDAFSPGYDGIDWPDFARKLERERDEIQNELNKCATQLVATINDRNFLGVQLDLIRDELLRISARIGETGLLNEHPGLRSIFDYCERAQKDISVNYTPIQERDAWKAKAQQFERERDEARNENIELSASHLRATKSRDFWKAKAERVCVWSNREWSEFCKTECGERFPIPRQVKYKCCPSCGGRIVKEEE